MATTNTQLEAPVEPISPILRQAPNFQPSHLPARSRPTLSRDFPRPNSPLLDILSTGNIAMDLSNHEDAAAAGREEALQRRIKELEEQLISEKSPEKNATW